MTRDIKYLVLALAMAATAGAVSPPTLRGAKDASGAAEPYARADAETDATSYYTVTGAETGDVGHRNEPPPPDPRSRGPAPYAAVTLCLLPVAMV